MHRDFRNRDMSLRAGFTFVRRALNQSNMRKRRIRRIYHMLPWFGQYETPNVLRKREFEDLSIHGLSLSVATSHGLGMSVERLTSQPGDENKAVSKRSQHRESL